MTKRRAEHNRLQYCYTEIETLEQKKNTASLALMGATKSKTNQASVNYYMKSNRFMSKQPFRVRSRPWRAIKEGSKTFDLTRFIT